MHALVQMDKSLEGFRQRRKKQTNLEGARRAVSDFSSVQLVYSQKWAGCLIRSWSEDNSRMSSFLQL